jgi:hypothetical protein
VCAAWCSTNTARGYPPLGSTCTWVTWCS